MAAAWPMTEAVPKCAWTRNPEKRDEILDIAPSFDNPAKIGVIGFGREFSGEGTLMRNLIAVFLLATLAAISPLAALAGPFTQIVAFGDSLTDTGNLEILQPTAFSSPSGAFYGYYEGRFSNGPNWIDQLSTKLGVADPQPSLAGGTNYAYGAASADASFQTPGISVPYLSQQVQSYLQTSPVADPHALYTVWMGANDVFNNGLTNPSVPATAAGDVAAALTSLINAGGKHFLVPNLPGQGNTPRIAVDGPATVAALNAVDVAYNADLLADLNSLRAAHPGVTITMFDTYALLNSALQNPAAYGFTDTTDQLIQQGPNAIASQYLFWDSSHPTTAADTFIADGAFAALVPEPTTFVLAGMGLLGLGFAALRKKYRRA
jgi:phospholipase/lecithinase/hemolysin